MIRKNKPEDYEKIVGLLKEFFSTHNIFSKSDEEILKYLKEQKDDLLVLDKDNEVKAMMFLVNTGQNADGSHKLWKFRHFAFISQEYGQKLLEEAENITRESSETCKIELTISEIEVGFELYNRCGYIREGALENHYRWGETCYVMSKSFC